MVLWQYNTWTSFTVGGTDCDDTSVCQTLLTGWGWTNHRGGDCNEELDLVDGHDGSMPIGYYTYPGAGFNEADPTVCITDMDGDGYGGVSTIGCLDFMCRLI